MNGMNGMNGMKMKCIKGEKGLFFVGLFAVIILTLTGCPQEPPVETLQAVHLIVTFDTMGGGEVSEQEVDYGKTVRRPPDPAKTGFTFAGWYKEKEYLTVWDFESDTIEENTALYAKWAAIVYIISFDTCGGGVIANRSVESGGGIERPSDPKKTGFIFAGWYKEKEYLTVWDFENDTVEADTILYARWAETVYTVTFDNNGGAYADWHEEKQNVVEGGTARQPPGPKKVNLYFWYWATTPNGGEQFNFAYPVYRDETVYAQWYAEISFYDGDILLDTWQVKEGTVTDEPEAGVDHHGFAGWFTADGILWDWSLPVTESVNLYGRWDLDTYTVRFMLDGELLGTLAVEYGGMVPESAAPTPQYKEGHIFGGWYREQAFLYKWRFDEDRVNADTVIYGVLEPKVYTFSYISDGETLAKTAVSHGNIIPRPENSPVKTGFVFGGWYREEGALILWDFEKNAVLADTSVYAKWTVAAFTVNFVSDSLTIAVRTVYRGSLVSAPPIPEKAGHTFEGWCYEVDEVWDFDTHTVESNTILQASWILNICTVRFDTGLGGSAMQNQPVLWGNGLSDPGTPARAGFVFDGWYKEGECIRPWNFAVDVVTEDTTIYAKWWDGILRNLYVVHFDTGPDGSEVPDQTVAWGGRVTEPGTPVRGGFVFDGWYKEEEYVRLWNFAVDVVTEEGTTIYAKWLQP
jgi:uncharacterized repeat protein (TIGR02543 family)